MSMFNTWLKDTKGLEVSGIEKAEELAGYYNEYNEQQRNEIKSLVDSKASKEDIDALKSDLMANQAKQLESLNTALKSQGVAIQKVLDRDKTQSPSNVETIKKSLEENIGKLKALKANDRNGRFSFKVAGDMSLGGNVTGQDPQALRLPGWNDIPQRQVRFLDLFQMGSIQSNLVEWVYMANEDGAAGSTAEGAVKNQIDFDLIVTSQRVEKYTAFIKATDEMLDDISYINTLIQTQLRHKLLQAVETASYSGNGVTPNLNGVRTVATAWAAGASAGVVDNANIVDVLRVGVTQAILAEQPSPDYILMNPQDVLALKQIKVSGTDKRYVDALQMIAGELSMDGIPIIQTTLVAQDDFMLGNSSMQYMLQKDAISIEIGYDSDDFTKNYKTIRAEWRGVVYVMNNDRTGFIAGDFTTAKAALETP